MQAYSTGHPGVGPALGWGVRHVAGHQAASILTMAVTHSTTLETWIAQVGSDSALAGSACRANAAAGPHDASAQSKVEAGRAAGMCGE